MPDRLTPARALPRVTAHALAACGLFLPPLLYAAEPGWYAGFDTAWSAVGDADGRTYVPGTPGTPGTPASNNCLLGNLLGLGSLLDLLGGTGPQGCLLGLLGPGTPGTDPIPATEARSLRTRITFQDGLSGTLSLGYRFDGGLRPELSLAYAQNDWDEVTLYDGNTAGPASRSANRLTALRAMGNVWYDLDFDSRVLPYLGGGIGYQRTRISGELSASDNVLAYQIGAGIGLAVNDRTTVSLDYRYVTGDDPEYRTADGGRLSAEYAAHSAGLGLRYTFAPAPGIDSDGDGVIDRKDKCPNTPAGVPVDVRGCPLDRDGDGVPDSRDKCPNTSAGTEVGADGCPLADSDGDGVPDHRDRCPGTPAGLAVGPEGCPLDSDDDGVPDHLDQCPTSPKGAKVLPDGCAPKGDCRRPRPGEAVDRNGCAVDQRFILRGVKFDFDSDRLTAEARTILDSVAQTLLAYPDIDVDLEGHTDDIGTDAYNLGLAERRANAVKHYLAGHGVAARRMHPVGYGESRPIDSNDTETGRDNNRRVELKVIE